MSNNHLIRNFLRNGRLRVNIVKIFNNVKIIWFWRNFSLSPDLYPTNNHFSNSGQKNNNFESKNKIQGRNRKTNVDDNKRPSPNMMHLQKRLFETINK